tara:strand:+ start:2233 stop:2568 length:336 start_codon:yes stop_codon:yes gene_type:complete
MSHLFFDLNIYNYSINELKQLIGIEEEYNIEMVESTIDNVKEKLLTLDLEKDENQEYFLFLNQMKLILKIDLEEIEKKELKENIDFLKKQQRRMEEELDNLRKNERKIKKD